MSCNETYSVVIKNCIFNQKPHFPSFCKFLNKKGKLELDVIKSMWVYTAVEGIYYDIDNLT